MADDVLTIFAEGRVDAKSLSGFMSEPAGKLVPRRLAPPVESFDTHIDRITIAETAAALIVQTIPDTVNAAIEGVAIDANLVTDALIKTVPKFPDTPSRTQSSINSDYTNIHDFGVIGDGVTDDSQAIQKAIDKLSDRFALTGIEQYLWYMPNKTYLCRNVSMKAGVHHLALGGKARIKKTPAPSGSTEETAKYWRVFAVANNEPSFNTEAARKVRHAFTNLIFDGNMRNLFWSGGYGQQQAASLFLTGMVSSSITSAEQRNKFAVIDCKFVDSVADGCGIWYNADVVVKNLEASDCFRGGLVASGGNTILSVKGYTSTRARIDFEVDSSGFGGSYKFDCTIDDVSIDKNNPNPTAMYGGSASFGADLCVSGGGKLIANNVNVYSTPVNFNGRSAGPINAANELSFTKSVFYTSSSGSANYIYPCKTLFHDTKFIAAKENSSISAFRISWAVNGGTPTTNTLVVFDGCDFEYLEGLSGTKVSGVTSNRVLSTTTGNTLKFRDCNVLGVFRSGVLGDGSVSIDWDGGSTNATYAIESNHAYNSAASKVVIGNYIPLDGNQYMLLTNTTNGTSVVNTIQFNNTSLPVEKSKVFVPTGNGVTGRVDKIIGYRTLLSDIAPISTTSAYSGDKVVLNKPVQGYPYEWICTSDNFKESSTTWQATKWLTKGYSTATLPTLTANDVGAQNIDTTLNKVVTWTGTAWI